MDGRSWTAHSEFNEENWKYLSGSQMLLKIMEWILAMVVDTEIEPSHLGLREQLTVSFRRRWEDRTIFWPKSVLTKEPEMI